MLDYFIKRKIRSNLNDLNRNRNFGGLDDIRTITIIFEVSDIERAKNLQFLLNSEGKNCNMFGFYNQKNKLGDSIDEFAFSKADLSIFQFPNEAVIVEFNKIVESSQLLIDLTYNNYLSINYLISSNNSNLKVGIAKIGIDLYDFVVEIQKNVDSKFLSEQILFYLRKLKSQR
ncbi:MAG: hypothetical protein PHV20_08850 [Bacteroidales bacterium]|nr:hypothetical protein [Bacteroidales bacterium]